MRTPPRVACWLLRLRLSKVHYECIAGDLCEEFQKENRSNSWFENSQHHPLPTVVWAHCEALQCYQRQYA